MALAEQELTGEANHRGRRWSVVSSYIEAVAKDTIHRNTPLRSDLNMIERNLMQFLPPEPEEEPAVAIPMPIEPEDPLKAEMKTLGIREKSRHYDYLANNLHTGARQTIDQLLTSVHARVTDLQVIQTVTQEDPKNNEETHEWYGITRTIPVEAHTVEHFTYGENNLEEKFLDKGEDSCLLVMGSAGVDKDTAIEISEKIVSAIEGYVGVREDRFKSMQNEPNEEISKESKEVVRPPQEAIDLVCYSAEEQRVIFELQKERFPNLTKMLMPEEETSIPNTTVKGLTYESHGKRGKTNGKYERIFKIKSLDGSGKSVLIIIPRVPLERVLSVMTSVTSTQISG